MLRGLQNLFPFIPTLAMLFKTDFFIDPKFVAFWFYSQSTPL